MPSISNPNSSIDAELLSACDAALKFYAADTVLGEAAIVAPNTGYKMYRKRQALAQKLLTGDATAEIESFAVLANNNSDFSNLRLQAESNNTPIYRFLISDNPMGAHVATATSQIVGWSVGNPGETLFDNIAGVTAEDLL